MWKIPLPGGDYSTRPVAATFIQGARMHTTNMHNKQMSTNKIKLLEVITVRDEGDLQKDPWGR